MIVIVLLSPINFFNFFLTFEFSFINLKPLCSQSKGDNDYLPFQKTNKSIKK